MKLKNWFWGLFFILAACLVIVNQFGYLTGINAFRLLATVFLVAIIIKSATCINFSGILFPFALLGILYAEPLGIQNLVPWPILIAALFLTIGLSFIFHKSIHHSYCCHYHDKDEDHDEHFDEIIDTPDDSNVSCDVRFGSAIKYVNTENFQKGSFRCSFGALKVYFEHAQMQEAEAVLYLDISFAGAEIYLPKDWKVIDNLNTSLAGVEMKNRAANPTKKLILKGNVKFSGVEIIYI